MLSMRYFLFFFILTVTGCAGQPSSPEQSKIDTAKLFNPNGHPDNAGARDLNMFERAIAVVESGYAIRLNDKETNFRTLFEAENFIISNKEEIKKDLFYILMVSTTDFNTAVSVVNVLTKNQVTNYKVINVEQYFTPPEPVSIQAPTPVETTTRLNDSAYFLIEASDKDITVTLHGKESNLKNLTDLDLFVAEHKQNIKEIVIAVDKNIPAVKFTSVLEVLKKHELNKFSVVSKRVK